MTIRYQFLTSTLLLDNAQPEINRLLLQLSPTIPLVSIGNILSLIEQGYLLAAIDTSTESMIAMSSLVVYSTIHGRYGRIEDMIVDKEYRGQGIGRTLLSKLVEQAEDIQLQSVALTSNPTRIAANKLYQSYGFGLLDTNVYVYRLGQE